MAKVKTKTGHVCTDCGAVYPKWQGHCTACGAWSTIKEVRLGPAGRSDAAAGFSGATSAVMLLSEVSCADEPRFTSGSIELDRVLGGGFVPGSVILIGGDPGAGKSTILLQTMCHAAREREVLYVSGEESLQQIAARAKRLGLATDRVKMLAECSVERVLDVAGSERPQVLVIDSIQVMQTESVDSAPGGVSQVRESAATLTRYAKTNGVVLIMVGHVTKDSSLAGPMTLSHMVDTQIMLSSTEDARYRLMRTTKNRFGAVNELGVFAMTEQGLREVRNPSAIFLSRSESIAPGSLISVLWEGTRPLLVEIQSLVVEAQYGTPRRLGIGLDNNRIAMILAVLTKHGGLVVSDQDVFVNVVGGIRVLETSADLAVTLAIASSLRNRALSHELLVFGEVGLSGEIRPVSNGEARLKEGAKHGFTRAIVPKGNVPKRGVEGVEIVGVSDLNEALQAILG
ncbi:DNA repair protein RadA [Geomesophilobacter sediminis]|uniref:DNA repair protein RadA n=1 Tax=Geomesophilobacter sediminis TaxID=2798584 RepID=A0A8J7J4G5_9BACT|nr:DNA repair protein RadA [Geomesophilobacter sediminis]MBJ6725758.1 DNA repair protein RadA [Geomesophilobacter sediminis]